MDKILLKNNPCGDRSNFPHFGSSRDAPFETIRGPCTPLYNQLGKKSSRLVIPTQCNQCVYDAVEEAQGGANKCGEICVGDHRQEETNAACHDPWISNGPDYIPTRQEWCTLARCVENQRKRDDPKDKCKNPCEELDRILFNNRQHDSSDYCFGL